MGFHDFIEVKVRNTSPFVVLKKLVQNLDKLIIYKTYRFIVADLKLLVLMLEFREYVELIDKIDG